MPISLKDYFPFTHEQAVTSLLGASWSDDELGMIAKRGSVYLHHGFGDDLRSSWGLWERSWPLATFYRNNLGLGHADDTSGLIISDFVAKATGADFDLATEAANYRSYWMAMGVNPLSLEKA